MEALLGDFRKQQRASTRSRMEYAVQNKTKIKHFQDRFDRFERIMNGMLSLLNMRNQDEMNEKLDDILRWQDEDAQSRDALVEIVSKLFHDSDQRPRKRPTAPSQIRIRRTCSQVRNQLASGLMDAGISAESIRIAQQNTTWELFEPSSINTSSNIATQSAAQASSSISDVPAE